MISRGLTAGSFGILEVERGNQRFVVRWNGLFMFLQTLDIARWRPWPFSWPHPAVARTLRSRQHRHNRCEPAFGLRPQHHIEMTAGFLHTHLHLIGWVRGGQILLKRGRPAPHRIPPSGIDVGKLEGAEGTA